MSISELRSRQKLNPIRFIWRERLSYAFDRACDATKKRASINKRNYDVSARDSCLHPGDRVLVRNLSIRGKHKLSNRWEDHIHRVVEKVNDLPVYKVKSEDTGRLRVLHRNLLLPVAVFEEGDMDIPLEDLHSFYPINADGKLAPDDRVNGEETERTGTTEPCINSSEQDTEMGNSSSSEADGTPIDDDSQDNEGVTQTEVRTRSGRVSRPPERYNFDIRCYMKVHVLLSLVNNTNHILVKELLRDWLNEPPD